MPFCSYCGAEVQRISSAPCPSCGRPANGAPPPKKGGNTVAVVLIVLAVGFGVVIIVGILAAIAIPNFLTAKERAKQKRTLAEVRNIAVAVEQWAEENQRYPSPDEVERALVPKHLTAWPLNDEWENTIRYECWNPDGGSTCTHYAIGSSGKDGRFDRSSLREYEGGGATTKFDADIVFMNGQFVQYPQGVQN